MERGFAGVLVALAFSLALLHARALAGDLSEQSLETEIAALKIINLRVVEGDFKTSLKAVFNKAGRGEKHPETRNKILAEKLGAWEKYFEEKYGGKGASVDAWVGSLSAGEKTALLKQMLDEQKPLKCLLCNDLSLEAVKASLISESQLPKTSFGISVFLEKEKIASIIEWIE